MMLGVRIGVCSDVHGRHDRLLAVVGAMAAAGVDERWCLGDLAGGEPVTAELVGAARQLDLLIAGNHDAWALGPDRVVAPDATCSGCRAAPRPAVTASTAGTARHATRCSGSSPRRLPPRSCPTAPWARSGSSAIPMNRRCSPTTAPRRARATRSGRVVRLACDRRLHGQPGGGLRQPARRGELVAHRRHRRPRGAVAPQGARVRGSCRLRLAVVFAEGFDGVLELAVTDGFAYRSSFFFFKKKKKKKKKKKPDRPVRAPLDSDVHVNRSSWCDEIGCS